VRRRAIRRLPALLAKPAGDLLVGRLLRHACPALPARPLFSDSPQCSDPCPKRLMTHAGEPARTFPPHVARCRLGDVGEDGVLSDGGHGAGVGVLGRSWGDAKEASFGVDGVQPSIRAESARTILEMIGMLLLFA